MIRKKFFASLIAVGMMICAFVAQAEIKTYTGVGEDYANQFETQEDAKLRAKRIAIEDAKKHAGVGLKTYSRTVNSELVDDEISTITSNSYKIVGDVKYEQILKPLTDRITVIVWRATVDVDVDDSEVKAWARRTADEKKALINRNRAAEEAFNENIKSADDLKRRAFNVSTEKELFDLKHEVEASNNDLQVNQKIEDGNKLNYEEKPDEALEKYGEALETKFVDGVGEYRMLTDVETMEFAKDRSKRIAEQEAMSEGIRYLKNYSRRINLDLTDDEISVIANNTYYILEIAQQEIPSEDNSHLIIRTNARLEFRGNEVIRWSKLDKNERAQLVENHKIIQKAFDKNDNVHDRLVQQYESQTQRRSAND